MSIECHEIFVYFWWNLAPVRSVAVRFHQVFFCNFQKKLFTTHKHKCSLKFWLECVMWDTLSFNTVTCGKIESVLCVCVCVCVYCTLTCSSGDYFRKRFRKNTKVRGKKCFSSHPTVSEALVVHAGVIEMVLIPKGCSYFVWNRSPETEMVNKVVCLVLRHCSSQPATLGSLGFTLFTRLCTASGKSFHSWSLLDLAVAAVIASNLFIHFC